MSSQQSWYGKLQNIDVRYVYLLVMILVAIPILAPIGLPVGKLSEETARLYDYIDKLPSGAVVVMIADQSPAAAAECQPGFEAILYHLKSKGLRALFFAERTDAVPFIESAMLKIYGATSKHPDYGKLIANLGYIPQGELGVRGLASDVFFTGRDAYGNDLKILPFFKDLKNARDWSLAIYFGASELDHVVRQVTDPFGCPTGGGVAAVLSTRIYPYYPSKVIGFLIGLRGSAEYELLIKKPGEAAAGMDAQSFGHALIIILVVIGNIGYFMERMRRGGGS